MAGKDFTTLADIANLSEACAVAPKPASPTPPDTARAMAAALDALDKL
jgi:hypothetical protein